MAHQILVDNRHPYRLGMDRSDAVHTMEILEKDQICVSVIIAMELYTGCRSKKELKEIDKLLEDFTLFHITPVVSERAFKWMKKYRPKYGVEINDMLIAGTAYVKGLKLISKNQKHYKFIPDLDLLEYPLVGV